MVDAEPWSLENSIWQGRAAWWSLLLNVHHIATDGWSGAVVLQPELSMLLRTERDSMQSSLGLPTDDSEAGSSPSDGALPPLPALQSAPQGGRPG